MTSNEKLAFLAKIAEKIPALFTAIEKGNYKSEVLLGVRTINGKAVQLKLVAEVDDCGNPLENHASAGYRDKI